MEDPITVRWGVTISAEDLKKIEAGFEPRDLAYMYHIQPMPREKNSTKLIVHFARFWGRAPIYTIIIEPNADSASGEATIESITWEQFDGDDVLTEYWAKRELVLVFRSHLECDLPGLPELSEDEWYPKYLAYRHNPPVYS